MRLQGVQAVGSAVMFRLQRIEPWGFDSETLFIARKLKCVIREVAVT